jgi:hypothetical protein
MVYPVRVSTATAAPPSRTLSYTAPMLQTASHSGSEAGERDAAPPVVRHLRQVLL